LDKSPRGHEHGVRENLTGATTVALLAGLGQQIDGRVIQKRQSWHRMAQRITPYQKHHKGGHKY
jgi:uncharacterized membrane protein